MKNIFGFLSLILLFACNNAEKKAVETDVNKPFEEYKNNFINELWQTYPGWALGVGKHDFDSILVIPNEDTRKKELSFTNNHLDSL
ncbi:MAG TPA: DUF885 domain-containing protein, partial [Vicingus sp.]|nr:DUF885 domain-containing protein [Vicingus sp.]